MNYTDIIRGLLDQQYPSAEDTHNMVIANIVIRILPLPARPYFMRYHNLQTLVINKCDLRNLQNFPKLVSLKQLDLSENSLQGTLNYLMPLTQLNYLNISNNLISDCKKLLPLQTIEGLQIYAAGNPFPDGQTWKTKLRNYGLKVLKQPRRLQILSKKVKQEDKVQDKKETKQQQNIIQRANKIRQNLAQRKQLYNEMRLNLKRTMLRHQRQLQIEHRNPLLDSDSMSLLEALQMGEQQIDNDEEQPQEEEELEELEDDSDQEEGGRQNGGEEGEEEENEDAYQEYLDMPMLDAFDGEEDLEQEEDPFDQGLSDD